MKLKTLIVAGALALGSLAGASLVPGDTYAAGSCPDGALRDNYEHSLAECNMPEDAPGTEKPLMERVVDIINVIVGIVGVLAVVVIVIGAILFVTSTGEAAKTTRARNTMLYGVVGLVISLLAFAIVNFVLSAVFGSKSGSTGSEDANSSQQESNKGNN